MPRISINNFIRSPLIGSVKSVATSKAKMDFSRISSTYQMPSTFLLNQEQTHNRENAFFHTSQNGNKFMEGLFPKGIDISSATSQLKEIFTALQKNNSENTITVQENKTEVKESIIKTQEKIIKVQGNIIKAQENENTDVSQFDIISNRKLSAPNLDETVKVDHSAKQRRFSAPLPVIKFENTEKNNKLNESSKISKVELIGNAFSAEKLLFSESLQKTADKYGVVIGLRYPSELGQIHLKEGFPTKNFHVKAKSSSTGPTAGFIAENPKYSKVPSSRWEKQESYIKDALSKGSELVDLSLNQVQIDHALDNGAMIKINENLFVATYYDEKVIFSISPPDNIVRELDGSPVRVLTNPPESDGYESIKKPITADYDLFCIVPKTNQSVNLRPLSVGNKVIKFNEKNKSEAILGKENDYINSGGVSAFHKARQVFLEPKGNPDALDKDKGNLHFFADVLINDINKNVKEEGFQGGKLVWHGEEIANPYSEGFDPADKPVFFIPKQDPQQVQTKEELRAFFDELRNAGFAPDKNLRFDI